ncbi:hypothetical protein QE152_g29188 [Popillia japonica]|uniref:Transposase n=1 Tax=Popillia japonica TaxID=7064 RepID=A0AAW1JIL0_POPJA
MNSERDENDDDIYDNNDYSEDEDDYFDVDDADEIQAEEATDAPTSSLTDYKWEHFGSRDRVEKSRNMQMQQLKNTENLEPRKQTAPNKTVQRATTRSKSNTIDDASTLTQNSPVYTTHTAQKKNLASESSDINKQPEEKNNTMPRSYKKSTARQFCSENMKQAAIDVIENNTSCRESEGNSLNIPDAWKENKLDWCWAFLKQHPKLSIRKPVATSLARMTSFNPTNVNIFQEKLGEVIGRYLFEPGQIFNLDETGVTTVQKVPKIVGKKGEHQIGQVTSRERGELGIICAAGSALPPIWIFPRHRFVEKRMMNSVSDYGALGLVHPSGWMTSDNFLAALKHITKHTKCYLR